MRISCAPPRRPARRSRPASASTPRAASPSSRCSRPTIRGCCRSSPAPARSAGANIVDAQIFTTTDGLALDTISVSREFERDEDEARRAARIGDAIEKALRGELKLPDVVAKRAPPKGRLKAFAVEPEVIINNQWSNRYTVVEVTGLDRPGLLYELTTTLSKLNLNIASAHVATFGERVVDVFYVTDLLGAQITAPTRQVAIKRALIAVFAAPSAEAKPAKEAARGVSCSAPVAPCAGPRVAARRRERFGRKRPTPRSNLPTLAPPCPTGRRVQPSNRPLNRAL